MLNRDPVDLMLRASRRRALSRALLAALPVSAWACHPPGVVPAAMPVTPTDPLPPEPSVAPPPVSVPERVQCEQGGNFPVAARNLKPALPVDYLAVRSASGVPNQGSAPDWTQSTFEVLSHWGTPCSSAPAGSACQSQVAHHPVAFANPQCLQMCREISVVTTRGGEVRRWATPQELGDLLAPIDTVDEALLLAQAAHYNVSCEAETTQARRTVRGFEVYATKMTAMCAPMITMGYWLRVTDTGEVSEISAEERSRSDACVGRKPVGLGRRAPQGEASRCVAFLSESAYLEAASVLAFERLARELEAHDAPKDLVEGALRARDEEEAHTSMVRELARVFGDSQAWSAPQLALDEVRSLEEMAHENAVEGCVRETYGALVGAFQGVRARNAEVRQSMRVIAEDELDHAALSHRIHAWFMTRLDASARTRIEEAMAHAIAGLLKEVARRSWSPEQQELEQQLGLPNHLEAQALVHQLARDVWRGQLKHVC